MSPPQRIVSPPATAEDVRTHLVHALTADLIGPFAPKRSAFHRPNAADTPSPENADPNAQDELLPLSPSRWYLTGFLVPETHRELEIGDVDENDEDHAAEDAPNEPDGGASDPAPKARKGFLPASVGLSVLLPPKAQSILVTVTYGVLIPDFLPQTGREIRQGHVS